MFFPQGRAVIASAVLSFAIIAPVSSQAKMAPRQQLEEAAGQAGEAPIDENTPGQSAKEACRVQREIVKACTDRAGSAGAAQRCLGMARAWNAECGKFYR